MRRLGQYPPGWVYPRACGGTVWNDDVSLGSTGLSPRLRGNRAFGKIVPHERRSIPAPAGEPHRVGNIKRNGEAYPRACGGTIWSIAIDSPAMGLSPRLRGNQGTLAGLLGRRGSIPAPAGEPWAAPTERRPPSVYPRACGGTKRNLSEMPSILGLSPRLRGNRVCYARAGPP